MVILVTRNGVLPAFVCRKINWIKKKINTISSKPRLTKRVDRKSMAVFATSCISH